MILDAFRAITLALDAGAAAYILHVAQAGWNTGLPHLRLVSIGTLSAVFVVAADTVSRVGKPFIWWETPFNFIFAACLILAMRRLIVHTRLGLDGPPIGIEDRRASPKTEELATRVTWIMMAVLATFCVYAFGDLTDKSTRQSRDTCKVQQLSIRASKHLAPVMANIDLLLKVPPRPGQKVPPSVRKTVLQTQRNLEQYVALVNSEPSERSCP